MQSKPRFQELRETYYGERGDIMRDLTKKELARRLNISYEIVKNLESGKKQDYSIEILKAYCDFFGVSADYLLGLSDVHEDDPDLKMISNYTGLTDSSIWSLHALKEFYEYNPTLLDTLNKILTSGNVYDFFQIITNLIQPTSFVKAYSDVPGEIGSHSTSMHVKNEAVLEELEITHLYLSQKTNEGYTHINHVIEINEEAIESILLHQLLSVLKKLKEGETNGKETDTARKRSGKRK